MTKKIIVIKKWTVVVIWELSNAVGARIAVIKVSTPVGTRRDLYRIEEKVMLPTHR